MDPKRQDELNQYYTAMVIGGKPPAGIKAPTAEEARQYGSQIDTRTTVEPSGGPVRRGSAPAPRGQTGRARPPATTGGATPADQADIANQYAPSGAGSGRTAAPAPVGQTASTRGPSSGNRAPGGQDGTAAPTGPGGERSLWSEALHTAMEEAGGDPRALRMPYEQHPAQVFDRYQNVAQPGYGRPVQNTMPGQPPAPQGRQFPPFPGGAPAMDRAGQTFNGAMDRVSQVRPQMPMPGGFPGQDRPMPVPQGGPPPRFANPEVSRPMQSSFRGGPSYSPPPSYSRSAPPRQESAEDMIARYQATGSF